MEKSVTIIPAQPGFYVINVFGGAGIHKAPVIAWRLALDDNMNIYTDPITCDVTDDHAFNRLVNILTADGQVITPTAWFESLEGFLKFETEKAQEAAQ